MLASDLRPRGTEKTVAPSPTIVESKRDPFSVCMKCETPLSGVTKIPKVISDLSIVLNCGHVLCNKCVHLNDSTSVNRSRPSHCRHDFQCSICGLMSPPLTIPNGVRICERRYQNSTGDCKCAICINPNQTKNQGSRLNNIAYCGMHKEYPVKYFCHQCGKHLCEMCVIQFSDEFSQPGHTLTNIAREDPNLENALLHGSLIHENLKALQNEAVQNFQSFKKRAENMRNNMGCYFIAIINVAIARYCQIHAAVQLEENKMENLLSEIIKDIDDAKRRIEIGKELDELSRSRTLMPELFVANSYKASAQKIFRDASTHHNKATKNVKSLKTHRVEFTTIKKPENIINFISGLFSEFSSSNEHSTSTLNIPPCNKLFAPNGQPIIEIQPSHLKLTDKDFSTSPLSVNLLSDGYSRFRSALHACGLDQKEPMNIHSSLIPKVVQEKLISSEMTPINYAKIAYNNLASTNLTKSDSTKNPSTSSEPSVLLPIFNEEKAKRQEMLLKCIRSASALESDAALKPTATTKSQYDLCRPINYRSKSQKPSSSSVSPAATTSYKPKRSTASCTATANVGKIEPISSSRLQELLNIASESRFPSAASSSSRSTPVSSLSQSNTERHIQSVSRHSSSEASQRSFVSNRQKLAPPNVPSPKLSEPSRILEQIKAIQSSAPLMPPEDPKPTIQTSNMSTIPYRVRIPFRPEFSKRNDDPHRQVDPLYPVQTLNNSRIVTEKKAGNLSEPSKQVQKPSTLSTPDSLGVGTSSNDQNSKETVIPNLIRMLKEEIMSRTKNPDFCDQPCSSNNAHPEGKLIPHCSENEKQSAKKSEKTVRKLRENRMKKCPPIPQNIISFLRTSTTFTSLNAQHQIEILRQAQKYSNRAFLKKYSRHSLLSNKELASKLLEMMKQFSMEEKESLTNDQANKKDDVSPSTSNGFLENQSPRLKEIRFISQKVRNYFPKLKAIKLSDCNSTKHFDSAESLKKTETPTANSSAFPESPKSDDPSTSDITKFNTMIVNNQQPHLSTPRMLSPRFVENKTSENQSKYETSSNREEENNRYENDPLKNQKLASSYSSAAQKPIYSKSNVSISNSQNNRIGGSNLLKKIIKEEIEDDYLAEPKPMTSNVSMEHKRLLFLKEVVDNRIQDHLNLCGKSSGSIDVKPDLEELRRDMEYSTFLSKEIDALSSSSYSSSSTSISTAETPCVGGNGSSPAVQNGPNGRLILRLPRNALQTNSSEIQLVRPKIEPIASTSDEDSNTTPSVYECHQKATTSMIDQIRDDDTESVRTLDDDGTHRWCYVCNDNKQEVIDEEKGICTTCPRVFHKDCTIPRLRVEFSEDDNWQCLFCKPVPPEVPGEPKNLLTPRNRHICQFILMKCFYTKTASFLLRSYVDPTKTLDVVAKRLEPDSPRAIETVKEFIQAVNEVLINSSTLNPTDSVKGRGTQKVWSLFRKAVKQYLPDFISDVWLYVSLFGKQVKRKHGSNGHGSVGSKKKK